MLEQRVLASLIDSGAYERRGAALLEGIARHLPASATFIGAAAGLRVVLWLPFLWPLDEPALEIEI